MKNSKICKKNENNLWCSCWSAQCYMLHWMYIYMSDCHVVNNKNRYEYTCKYTCIHAYMYYVEYNGRMWPLRFSHGAYIANTNVFWGVFVHVCTVMAGRSLAGYVCDRSCQRWCARKSGYDALYKYMYVCVCVRQYSTYIHTSCVHVFL